MSEATGKSYEIAVADLFSTYRDLPETRRPVFLKELCEAITMGSAFHDLMGVSATCGTLTWTDDDERNRTLTATCNDEPILELRVAPQNRREG